MFEYVYFARPDSHDERPLRSTRCASAWARRLARRRRLNADVVVPVPDSGVPAALGFAQDSGLPYDLGIIRNHYVGRTFIQPTQGVRELGVRMKHAANRAVLEGKRVVLIDDSIVRGTTSEKIVQHGARGRRRARCTCARPRRRSSGRTSTASTCPTATSCWPRKHVAGRDARACWSVDSLGFLSVEGLYWALGEARRNDAKPQFTDHYFTGDYPTRLLDREIAEGRNTADQPQLSFLVSALTQPLDGRIALVTGASRGIGRSAPSPLAEAGAHVVATARTKAGLEELDDAVFAATGAHATLVPLDIKDGKAIDQLGTILYERFRQARHPGLGRRGPRPDHAGRPP